MNSDKGSTLTGAPKLVAWAEKIRKERCKVWQETSPEIFRAIEAIVMQEKSADWWIAHKDKGLETICTLLRSGTLRQAGGQPRPVRRPERRRTRSGE